jgi:hypothetical protein
MAPSDQLSDGLGRAASSSERPRISDARRIRRSMLAEPTNASMGDVTCHILSRKKPRRVGALLHIVEEEAEVVLPVEEVDHLLGDRAVGH